MKRVLLVIAVASLQACTYAQLNTRGAAVQIVDKIPAGCENLGPVVGKGGGGGGEFVSNESLIEYSLNDARNKAAERGATHLTYMAPALGASGSNNGSTVTSAMVTGVAYRCRAGAELPEGAQPVEK